MAATRAAEMRGGSTVNQRDLKRFKKSLKDVNKWSARLGQRLPNTLEHRLTQPY